MHKYHDDQIIGTSAPSLYPFLGALSRKEYIHGKKQNCSGCKIRQADGY